MFLTSNSKGSAGAHHPVTHSRLPKPHLDCALYGMRVLEGKLILSGPEFFIGAKDTPEHIARKGNIRRLKWMSTKFVLLWDERDKRGWLVNGTTALLHIVRAFLSHAKEDNFKSAFQFKDEDFQEAKVPFTADSAIAVLLNPVNRRLKLYDEEEGDGDEYLLKTQIDHFYNILEQLIEYQADIAGLNGSKLGNNPRRFLEGWDFEDVAKECPTIYPRVATIGDAGKGWVDFIRAIHAVTIVGRGFGDIIRPTGRDHCDSWATLPTKRYYIASCVSDLDRLLKEAGSHQDGHELLCDNLIYHAPASVYRPCQCRVTPGRKHCEPVRTLIPSAMSTAIPFRKSATKLQELGAVILGYSSHFPLIWGDTGPPERGELPETEPSPKTIEEDVDSGFGSNTTVSEIENHSFFQPNSETESSVKPEELQSPAAKKALPNVTISIEQKIHTRNQYTVGIICPLPKELMAVRALFDYRHPKLATISGDSNHYALGIMEGHWVVATCLPSGEYGTNAAASVASSMICNFPSIRFCLLVGIGGGVPSEKRDVRLGDVVVSQPTGTNSGVLQYDLGKEEDGDRFRLVGSLQRPPRVLTKAIGFLRSEPLAGRLEKCLSKVIDCLPTYKHPGQELDVPTQATCASCNSWQWLLGSCSHIRQRLPRTTTMPTIHYGLVASGNRVIKDKKFRNRLARDHDILCFEMEAAGVINTVDCLVIRGICDYCDAQKNDVWQEYAAAAAAAYAKLLLGVVTEVEQHGNASQ